MTTATQTTTSPARPLSTAQIIYRELTTSNFGRDVEFIANVIFTSAGKPTRKLRGLLALVKSGMEVRCGNDIFSVRIEGEYYDSLKVFEDCRNQPMPRN